MEMPVINAGPQADRFRADSFSLHAIPAQGDATQYDRLLAETYEPLGFMTREFLPSERSQRYYVTHGGHVVAIFRLTRVEDPASAYFELVPGAVREGRRAPLAEVNNVVIASPYRASILLGLLLYESAKLAHALECDYVVGITRHQTLRFFVDFGVIPVDHPPLHLLGKPHLLDFVIYYDTRTPASIAYMHERARRYFHQQYVMRNIQEKYVRPALRHPDTTRFNDAAALAA